MTIDFKYGIKTTVKIKALNLTGVVVALYCGDTGCQFSVRYTNNGEAKTVYFYDFELEEVK